jgi:2-C-methyl-D-erythritol 4-phosphate cytidylyltransferase
VSVAAVVVAAGSGDRLGADRPKALVSLGSKTILDWSVAAFVDHPDVDEVIVVAPPASTAFLASTLGLLVVHGGPNRSDSVQRGLSALSEDAEYVLVHDAARPLVPAQVIADVVAALRSGVQAAIPVLPMIDTVKQIDSDGAVETTVPRERLRRVQTPQGFQVDLLRAAYRAAAGAVLTDDAGVAEAAGVQVWTVAGDEASFKITTAHDLRIAELLVAGR